MGRQNGGTDPIQRIATNRFGPELNAFQVGAHLVALFRDIFVERQKSLKIFFALKGWPYISNKDQCEIIGRSPFSDSRYNTHIHYSTHNL